jgi:hypothetical protein
MPASTPRQDSAIPAKVTRFSKERRRERFERRSELVAKLASQLTRRTTPRLHLLAIMACAGGVAFLASAALLWSSVRVFDIMALRYGAAALCGYLTFLMLIRVWIALHRPRTESVFDGINPLDAIDFVDSTIHADAPSLYSGGRGGGGGATDQWGASGRSSGGDGWGLFDADGDFVWLVLAAICAAGGAVAIVYVIYLAPVLLAEVALDAAIISALYRRLRSDETGHWLTTVVNRTWLPALALVIFAGVTGFALQMFAPDAQSIGGVIRAISQR